MVRATNSGKINFIVTKGEQGEIDIERREITPMPEHLSRLFDEEGDAQVPGRARWRGRREREPVLRP
jgi:hypothetical protein